MFSHQEIVLHLLFLSVWKFCCCATQVSYCAFLRILSSNKLFFRFIITLALLRNLCVFTNCFMRDASPRAMTVSEVSFCSFVTFSARSRSRGEKVSCANRCLLGDTYLWVDIRLCGRATTCFRDSRSNAGCYMAWNGGVHLLPYTGSVSIFKTSVLTFSF